MLCAEFRGSGKSTWIKNNIQEKEIVVSRDDIRYSLLKDGEPYFAHEQDVFNIFCTSIASCLKNYNAVYADATHINKKSRSKLIKGLLTTNFNFNEIEKIAVYFKTPILECLNRNANRKGRAKVNEGVILDMANNFQPPTEEEYFDKIIIVGDKNE